MDGTEKIIERINGLLAKAESTEFPEEAEAFSAKAAELIERHSLEHAMFERERGEDISQADVGTFDFDISGSYFVALRSLAASIGQALGFTVVLIHGTQIARWYGFKDEIDLAQILWVSLRLQCDRACNSYMATYRSQNTLDDRSERHYERRSFIIGYGNRVGERIRDTRERTREQAVEEFGNSMALAIVDRSTALERWLEENANIGPSRKGRGMNITASGYAAGQSAAERADLGHGRLKR